MSSSQSPIRAASPPSSANDSSNSAIPSSYPSSPLTPSQVPLPESPVIALADRLAGPASEGDRILPPCFDSDGDGDSDGDCDGDCDCDGGLWDNTNLFDWLIPADLHDDIHNDSDCGYLTNSISEFPEGSWADHIEASSDNGSSDSQKPYQDNTHYKRSDIITDTNIGILVHPVLSRESPDSPRLPQRTRSGSRSCSCSPGRESTQVRQRSPQIRSRCDANRDDTDQGELANRLQNLELDHTAEDHPGGRGAFDPVVNHAGTDSLAEDIGNMAIHDEGNEVNGEDNLMRSMESYYRDNPDGNYSDQIRYDRAVAAIAAANGEAHRLYILHDEGYAAAMLRICELQRDVDIAGRRLFSSSSQKYPLRFNPANMLRSIDEAEEEQRCGRSPTPRSRNSR